MLRVTGWRTRRVGLGMKEVVVHRRGDKVDGGCTSCGSQRSRTSKQENVDDISTTSY